MTAATLDPIAILLDEHEAAMALFAELDGALVALAAAWRGYRAGTISCVRRSNLGGLLALFGDWSLDAAGRIVHEPSAPTRGASPAVRAPAQVRPAAAPGTPTSRPPHSSSRTRSVRRPRPPRRMAHRRRDSTCSSRPRRAGRGDGTSGPAVTSGLRTVHPIWIRRAGSSPPPTSSPSR